MRILRQRVFSEYEKLFSKSLDKLIPKNREDAKHLYKVLTEGGDISPEFIKILGRYTKNTHKLKNGVTSRGESFAKHIENKFGKEEINSEEIKRLLKDRLMKAATDAPKVLSEDLSKEELKKISDRMREESSFGGFGTVSTPEIFRGNNAFAIDVVDNNKLISNYHDALKFVNPKVEKAVNNGLKPVNDAFYGALNEASSKGLSRAITDETNKATIHELEHIRQIRNGEIKRRNRAEAMGYKMGFSPEMIANGFVDFDHFANYSGKHGKKMRRVYNRYASATRTLEHGANAADGLDPRAAKISNETYDLGSRLPIINRKL